MEDEANKKRFKAKIRAQKIKQLEEHLTDKIKQVDAKSTLLEKTKQSNESLKLQLKDAQEKLRVLSTTHIKELKKSLADKISEVDILKGMIRTRDVQLKSKDNELAHLDKKVRRMERLAEAQGFFFPSDNSARKNQKRRDIMVDSLERGIEEVTEVGTEEFERQGASRGHPAHRVTDENAYEDDEFCSFEGEESVVAALPTIK